MASQLLPRPVHGAVYKWTPNKHFLRLQESLKKNTKNNQKLNLRWKKIISTIHFQLHHAPLVFTCFTPPILRAFRSGRSGFLRPWQRPSNREAKCCYLPCVCQVYCVFVEQGWMRNCDMAWQITYLYFFWSMQHIQDVIRNSLHVGFINPFFTSKSTLLSTLNP